MSVSVAWLHGRESDGELAHQWWSGLEQVGGGTHAQVLGGGVLAVQLAARTAAPWSSRRSSAASSMSSVCVYGHPRPWRGSGSGLYVRRRWRGYTRRSYRAATVVGSPATRAAVPTSRTRGDALRPALGGLFRSGHPSCGATDWDLADFGPRRTRRHSSWS